jgi:hypothetical protein
LQTGARLALEASELERSGLERVPASLSLNAIVVANDPTVGAYLLDISINYVGLAVAAAVYWVLTFAGVRLFRVAGPARQAFLGGLSSALLFIVLALPTYVGIAFLLRHEPIGPGGLERQPDAHLATAEAVAFYAIQVAAVGFGLVRTKRIAHMAGGRLSLATGVAVLSFLVLIQPLAEFANACYVGGGFLLHPSC